MLSLLNPTHIMNPNIFQLYVNSYGYRKKQLYCIIIINDEFNNLIICIIVILLEIYLYNNY